MRAPRALASRYTKPRQLSEPRLQIHRYVPWQDSYLLSNGCKQVPRSNGPAHALESASLNGNARETGNRSE
jgi:hypothetical protein